MKFETENLYLFKQLKVINKVAELKNMDLFTTITDPKTRFIELFTKNPSHQWIFTHPKVHQCFQILFEEFSKEHLKYFTKHQVHFIYSHAELSFAVGNLKNESVVVIFPDLFKMMNSTLITEASATLAHELGHIYNKHHERKIDKLEAQFEADYFAWQLGFGEDLITTLHRFDEISEVKIRIKRLQNLIESENRILK